MKFNEKLVRLRKIRGITQDEFASAVGVSRQAVYKWECGQSYPEVSKLLEIKLLFGISIDDLLDDGYEIAAPEKKKRKRAPKKVEAQPIAAAAEEKADEEAVVEVVSTNAEPAIISVEVNDASEAAAEAAEPEIAPAIEQEPEVELEVEIIESEPEVEAENADEPAIEQSPASEKAEKKTESEAPVPEKKGFFRRLFGKK